MTHLSHTSSKPQRIQIKRKALASAIAFAFVSPLVQADSFYFEADVYQDGVLIDEDSGVNAGSDVSISLGLYSVDEGSTLPNQTCQVTGTLAIYENQNITAVNGGAFSLNVTIADGERTFGEPARIDLNIPSSAASEGSSRFRVGIVNRETSCETGESRLHIQGDSGYGFNLYKNILPALEKPPIDGPEDTSQAYYAIQAQLDAATTISIENAHDRTRRLSAELARRRSNSGGLDNSVSLNLKGTELSLAKLGGSAGESSFDPWGTFITGSIAAGERDDDGSLNIETQGSQLIAGVDYRWNNWVLGAALSWADTQADTSNLDKAVDVAQTGISVFSSFFSNGDAGNFYADLLYSQSTSDYDFQRNDGNIVAGSTDADDSSLALNLGFEGHAKKLDYGFYMSYDAVKVDVDGYAEASSNSSTLATIEDFNRKSARLDIGAKLSGVMNRSFGVLIPFSELVYRSNLNNDGLEIGASFPGSSAFKIETSQYDSSSMIAQLGINAIFPHGISAFAAYEVEFDRDDWAFARYDVGMRWEF